jgi:hypothetical protein
MSNKEETFATLTPGCTANPGHASHVASFALGAENRKKIIKTATRWRHENQFFNEVKFNGTMHFKKCKQLFKCQHLLLFRDIWRLKF